MKKILDQDRFIAFLFVDKGQKSFLRFSLLHTLHLFIVSFSWCKKCLILEKLHLLARFPHDTTFIWRLFKEFLMHTQCTTRIKVFRLFPLMISILALKLSRG